MSNYVGTTNFAAKDALAHADPLKVAKGAEVQVELNNIAVAIATKEDLANKNVNSGYAGLDATARILKAQAPAVTAYGDAANVFTLKQTLQPASGRGMDVLALAGQYGVLITGAATTGQSFGLDIVAGTNGSDAPFAINNQANTRNLFTVFGNGAVLVGNTTDNGGVTFAGTGGASIAGSLTVAGSVSAAALGGDGSSITNINATRLASGTVAAARLGSGTGSTSNYLRGDNVWVQPDFTVILGVATVAQIPSLPTSQITSGTFADARIALSNVSQHQGNLSIATTQLSGQVSAAQVPSGAVTQYNSSITGRNISAKAGISKTLQSGGTASGGSDGDIIYIY